MENEYIETNEYQTSGKISRTSAGKFTFEVKVYDDDGESWERRMRNMIARAEKMIAEREVL